MFYCYLISFLLHWACLSAYWKGKAEDMEWWNWFLHGFFIGLAMIPFVFIDVDLWLILFRSVVLGFTMMAWSVKVKKAAYNEFGRGALIVLTLPIL